MAKKKIARVGEYGTIGQIVELSISLGKELTRLKF
jgi:hypothetical protein